MNDGRKDMKNIIILSSNTLGSGDDKLGNLLMKSFIFKLAESDKKPDEMLLYNSAVNLVKSTSTLAGDFLKLQEYGTMIKSCGTCLSYYDISEEEIIGEVTSMEYIVSRLMSEDRIIKP